jgi:hypothetical protein
MFYSFPAEFTLNFAKRFTREPSLKCDSTARTHTPAHLVHDDERVVRAQVELGSHLLQSQQWSDVGDANEQRGVVGHAM